MKTVLPNACLREGSFGDHVRSREIRSTKSEMRTDATRLLHRVSGFVLPSGFGFFQHVTAITHRKDAVHPATIVATAPMQDFQNFCPLTRKN